LFKKSLNGEEKTNLSMPEELALGTLARKVSQLRRVCKIKDKFHIKLKRRKIQIKLNGLRWYLER
jgi:hypothetical protein